MDEHSGAGAARPYHHGDLKAALLAEAERILEQDGLQALTLRAAARGAGVSHAAPANHFGDLGGLLSELAAVGFNRFGTELAAAMDAVGADPHARIKEMGRAYVGFARRYPALFQLMFRSERLDMTRPALREAVDAAGEGLRQAVAARTSGHSDSPASVIAQVSALWSLVHGFAMLTIDGRMDAMAHTLPGGSGIDDLLEAVLTKVRVDD